VRKLLADVNALGKALRGTSAIRVYTSQEEALTALPSFCDSRGYACTFLPNHGDMTGEGDQRPYGRYRFDIGGI
jgi:hypothetical protein